MGRTAKIKDDNKISTPNSFNELGLRGNIEYPYKEDGYIDWKALIEPQQIVPNTKYFERYNKEVPKSAEGLADKEKIVLLAGYKKLAFIRGYKSVEYFPLGCGQDEISLSCKILWRGNAETDFEDVVYSSTANASVRNVENPLFATFLTTIAENRSFVRCVRNFLNIPILGQDELGPDENKNKKENNHDSTFTPGSPQWVLKNKLQEKSRSFDQLKKLMINKHLNLTTELTQDSISKWESEKDIPVSTIVVILGLLDKPKEESISGVH